MTISVKENGVWVERKSYAKTANVFKNVTPSQKVNNTYVSSKPKPNSTGPAVAFEIKAGNVTFIITNPTKPVSLQLRNTVTDAVTALGSYTSGVKTVTVPAGDVYHLEFTTEMVGTTTTSFSFSTNALISKIVSFDDNLYKLDGMPRTQSSALVQVPEALPVSVTNMSSMFSGATSFNQDLSTWDTGNVTNMTTMFYGATSFNQNISSWDTANVTNMNAMFYGATSFNGNISGWNTANVTNMNGMFQGAATFNQPIETWNVGKVTNMYAMFSRATSFNQNISGWDVAKVTDMGFMFQDATSFNGNTSTWNTSNVTNMIAMFYSAKAFNQNISGWDVAKVTTWANFRTDGCPLTTPNTPLKFR